MAKSTSEVEYLTGANQTDATAIAVATVQTSAMIIYTFYNINSSRDVNHPGCIVV